MDVHAALRNHFGYPDFRPGQEALVRAALEGRDALGILPTGGGKSVCYMLPAALLPGLTIVVSPLISLMEDQVVRAERAGISAGLLNSAQGADDRASVLERARSGRLKLLLLAPERFKVASFRRALDDLRVSLLAVDESHCISEWGHDFRPDYLALGDIRQALGCPTLALTATATPRVREEILAVLRLRRPERVVGSFDRPNLWWQVRRVGNEAERERATLLALRRLVRSGSGTAVLYAGTRRTVEALRQRLAGLGLPVGAYHGGMDASDRSGVQAAFMAGERRVVVATNAFGMGVDKPDVRLVVHWQLPGTLEAYYQEAGRAGRDGEPAHCMAFHRRGDEGLHQAFLDRSHPPPRRLHRLHRCLRGRLGPSRRGTVDPAGLARALGRGWTPADVLVGLHALQAGGVLHSRRPLPRPEDFSGAHERGGAEDLSGAHGSGETQDPSGAPGPSPSGGPGSARGAPGGGATVEIALLRGRPDLTTLRARRRIGREKIRAVARFRRARTCRRRQILAYFGEEGERGPCGRCDRCGPPLL